MRAPAALFVLHLVLMGPGAFAAGPRDCATQLGDGGPYRARGAMQFFEGTGIKLDLAAFEETADAAGAEAFVDALLRIFARHAELGSQGHFTALKAAAKDVDCGADGTVELNARASEERLERHLMRQVTERFYDIHNTVRDALETLSEDFKRDFGVELYFSKHETLEHVAKAQREVARLRALIEQNPDLAAMNGTIRKLALGMFYGGLDKDRDLWIKGNAFEWRILRALRAAIAEGRARVEAAEALEKRNSEVKAALEAELRHFSARNGGVTLSFKYSNEMSTDAEAQLVVVRRLSRLFEQHWGFSKAGFKEIQVSHNAAVTEYGSLWFDPKLSEAAAVQHLSTQAAFLRQMLQTKEWLSDAVIMLRRRISISVFVTSECRVLPKRNFEALFDAVAGAIDADRELSARLRGGDYSVNFNHGRSYLYLKKSIWLDCTMNPADVPSVLRALAFQEPEAEGASLAAHSTPRNPAAAGSETPSVADTAAVEAKARIAALKDHFVTGAPRPAKPPVK